MDQPGPGTVPGEPASGDQIRQAASQAVSQGIDIRARVHDLTLSALQQRRFDAQAFRDVIRAVAEGAVLGAEKSRTDMRLALSDAFSGLDEALTRSAKAGEQALRQLAESGRDFSEHELRQGLANLRRLEDDFLATVDQVASAASEKVRPEFSRVLGAARTSGTSTGRQVASTLAEFAQRFATASLDVALAGVQTAGEFGARFAMMAGGILSAVADALRAAPGSAESSRAAASSPTQPAPAVRPAPATQPTAAAQPMPPAADIGG